MKGRMKKAFAAFLAAAILVGGMPVNMQADVITEEKTESASEKVNEKYADTEELDLMDRERQETQAGEQEKRENTEQPETGETEQPDTEEQPDRETEQSEETEEQPDTETEQSEETEQPETEGQEEIYIRGEASEEQIAAEQKAWTLINKYADPDYFLTDPEREYMTDAQFEELRQAASQAVAGCTTQYEKIKAN